MVKDILTVLKEIGKKTGSKKVTLIECRDDIVKCRSLGYSLRQIWLALCESRGLTYTYDGFRRAVKKHLNIHVVMNSTMPITPDKKVASPPQTVAAAPPASAPAPDSQPEKPKFKVVRREDLYGSTEPEKPNPVQRREMTPEEQAERERKLEESIQRAREMSGKPFRFKSDYTLEQERLEREAKEKGES